MPNNLTGWDWQKEQQKADFLEHLYQVYQPKTHTYTGLWEKFCITEAGPAMRDRYFEMLDVIKQYEEMQAQNAALAAEKPQVVS